MSDTPNAGPLDAAQVRRFTVSRNENGLGFSNGIEPSTSGGYVLYDDFASLSLQLSEAQAWGLNLKRERDEAHGEVAQLAGMAAEEACRADAFAKALEFYANPAVYAPHPHGPAFDRRDISYRAKNVLAEFADKDELSPNYAACCQSTDLAACDCVDKQHIRVLFAKGGRKYQPTGGRL